MKIRLFHPTTLRLRNSVTQAHTEWLLQGFMICGEIELEYKICGKCNGYALNSL